MRHSYKGKKLSRTSNERQGLFRNLMKSMIRDGAIKTTKAKALAVRSELEKLITKAKKNTDFSRRQVLSVLSDGKLVDQIIEMSKTQFAPRTSGYTRIVKIGTRHGDGTEKVLLSFVDERIVPEIVVADKKGALKKNEVPNKEKKVSTKKNETKKK